jgi:hypothetical protein
MASGIYNRFKYNLMKKVIDLSNDVCKVILLDNDHSFNPDNNVLADIDSNEISPGSANGYIPGGKAITTPTVTQNDSSNKAVFDGDNVEWTSATFDAYHAAIYDDTVANDPLVGSIDFGGIKSVSSGTFTIQWHTDGIIESA